MTRAPGARFPLLPRPKTADKNRFGHVLVIAGSRGYYGSALLAAEAALRSGSGLVTMAAPAGIEEVMARKASPEIMHLSLPETKAVTLSLPAFGPILRHISRRHISCAVLGPGMSLHPETARLVRKLVRRCPCPIVLDADGINHFKGRPALLKKRAAPIVLTPHGREFRRLFGRQLPENQTEKSRIAKELSKTYGVVLVLKGHRTCVAAGEKLYVNHTGNPGMAKGGSGDALAGIIAAFIAQGLEPFRAAAWAVFYHGRAGDLAVKKIGELSLTASDLIAYLPKAFAKR